MYVLNPCLFSFEKVKVKIKCQSKVPTSQPTDQPNNHPYQPTNHPTNHPTNQPPIPTLQTLANLTNYSKLPVTDFQTKIYLPITNKHIDRL